MVRKRVKRAVKKSVRKSSVNSSSNKPKKHWMTSTGWIFVKLVLLVIFIYGLWVMWSKPSDGPIPGGSGLSIIVADLLIIFIIKLVLKFKKK
mgnify:CR=1 FL=1